MQKDELANLKDLMAKMTPGEWRASEIDQGVQIYNSAFTYIGETRDLHGNDAAGIVALVNAAPALIASAARAAELEAEVAKLNAIIDYMTSTVERVVAELEAGKVQQ